MSMVLGFFITNIENKISLNTGKANVARANDYGNFNSVIFEAVKGAEAYSIFDNEEIKFYGRNFRL